MGKGLLTAQTVVHEHFKESIHKKSWFVTATLHSQQVWLHAYICLKYETVYINRACNEGNVGYWHREQERNGWIRSGSLNSYGSGKAQQYYLWPTAD